MSVPRHRFLYPLLLCALCACSSNLPAPETFHKPVSRHLPAPAAAPMAQLARAHARAHTGESGVYPVTSAQDALAVRLSAIRAARTGIDIQYFIFRRDETGLLVTHELLQAARRGVRVRFLMDDFPTTGDDERMLAMLDRHPNVEVRLFNPFPRRAPKWLEFLGDFPRLHRRMHNKSLTVDNSVTFIGGRNLGNQYFGIDKKQTFGDLDLQVVGAAVGEISKQFDLYWNNEFAYPLQALIVPPTNARQQRFAQKLERNSHDLMNSEYGASLQRSPVMQALQNDDALWYWGDTHTLYDTPEKLTRREESEAFTDSSGLMEQILAAREQLIVISPYVLPGEDYLRRLQEAAARGVEIHILTNSLASTDVVLVHGAYRKYREPLLAAGIHLYELPSNLDYRLDNWEPGSKSLLHAKMLVIDRHSLYVGSFNLDNRSFQLNTELGLLIHSPRLAGKVSTNFLDNIGDNTYRLELHQGSIRWRGRNGEIHTREPGASLLQRIGSVISGWLPIEHLL